MLLIAATFFMEILDGTILATAAPAMGRSFGVESAAISVAITSYLITLAVLIPASGWSADRFGTRTVFVWAIAVFTVASALCATSTGLAELTGLRIVQGVGAAMMVPVGRLVVLRNTARPDIVRAVAFLTWPALVAPIVAPLLGGWFVTYASWRWIFLVNVPLGVVAGLAGWRLVPQVKAELSRRLDWIGLVLCAVTSCAVVVVADTLGQSHVDGPLAGAAAAIAVAAGGLAARHLLSAPQPLLDLRLFATATFRVAHTAGSLLRMTVSAVPFLLPLLFQDGLGWRPVKAGAVVLWLFVGNLGIKPTTTWLLRRLGFRWMTAGAALILATSILAIGLVGRSTPLALVAVLLVISGAARSVTMTAVNTITFADVDDLHMSQANTLASTLTQLALGLGVALGAVCLRIGQAAPSGIGGATPEFRLAFLLLALVALVAAVEPLLLDRRAGAALLTG